MFFSTLNGELQAPVNTLLYVCTLDTKNTVSSVMWLNKKRLMHREAFSAGDHNNDKE